MKGSQKIIDNYEKQQGHEAFGKTLSVKKGKKYYKIIEEPKMGSGKSVWAFIDKNTGDIFRPASYSAPAKKPRGNIFDRDNGLKNITTYGPKYMRNI